MLAFVAAISAWVFLPSPGPSVIIDVGPGFTIHEATLASGTVSHFYYPSRVRWQISRWGKYFGLQTPVSARSFVFQSNVATNLLWIAFSGTPNWDYLECVYTNRQGQEVRGLRGTSPAEGNTAIHILPLTLPSADEVANRLVFFRNSANGERVFTARLP